MRRLSRRGFMLSLPLLPISKALADAKPLRIEAVEVWQFHGIRQTKRGVDSQYQANPLFIYDELRPAPYHDNPAATPTDVAVNSFYVRIQAEGGLEGLYGPIEKEAAIVVDEQLKPFLLGKDALAQEKLWDQMYRSNRHSRRGHFLMAISAVDNTLWDLRGRYFKTPVYRLLGGPTRSSVEAYASCLGFSLEPDKLQPRALQFKKEGFRFQKWFLAYGPGDGYEGLKKNVETVRLLRKAVG
jgi:L-alanine-DL-glutamate epimerase-like enolase superfamily enzyme